MFIPLKSEGTPTKLSVRRNKVFQHQTFCPNLEHLIVHYMMCIDGRRTKLSGKQRRRGHETSWWHPVLGQSVLSIRFSLSRDGMFWLQHKVQPSSRTERSCHLLGGSQQGAEREISNAVDLLQRVLVRQTARAQ